MLTLVPQGGLCNRLRVVLSAVQAKMSGAGPVRVEWGKDAECGAWFEGNDIFGKKNMGSKPKNKNYNR